MASGAALRVNLKYFLSIKWKTLLVGVSGRAVTNCLRPFQHWDRGFESHLGMDVCVCSVWVFSVSI
jgi:hypothetical protein